MEVVTWLVSHWLDLLQSIGIISGFVFTAHTIRKEATARQIGNMLAAAQHHHSIWKECYTSPHLLRVVEQAADLETKPITAEEQLFVTAIIIHLDSLHRAIRAGMFMQQEGIARDVKQFFALPIPGAVWDCVRSLHDRSFVEFIEACRKR